MSHCGSFATFSPLLIGERSATHTKNVAGAFGLTFSPLLIGERSATLFGRHTANADGLFQSPPHRGAVCNTFS